MRTSSKGQEIDTKSPNDITQKNLQWLRINTWSICLFSSIF